MTAKVNYGPLLFPYLFIASASALARVVIAVIQFCLSTAICDAKIEMARRTDEVCRNCNCHKKGYDYLQKKDRRIPPFNKIVTNAVPDAAD